MPDHYIVFSIIALMLALFATGWLRFDFVAIAMLMLAVLLGVVPHEAAFSGFGHPAVITVAAVLIISRALQNSGVVNVLSSLLSGSRGSETRQVAAGSGLVAILSSFMNNVGALAIMLPVTMKNARQSGRSPSTLLMPLSFASLLGGLVTLIGTPSNIVVSAFRQDLTGTSFEMFDFTPVGVVVAITGLIYLSFIGWRLIPQRVPAGSETGLFHVEDYISEVIVPEDSNVVGRSVLDLESECDNELTVMAIVRGGRRRLAPQGSEVIRGNDVLVLEGDLDILTPFITRGNLQALEEEIESGLNNSEDMRVAELVVLPNSNIVKQSMRAVRMHERHGINLLAISRRGDMPITRLANVRFRTGDVLLVQGDRSAIEQACNSLGFLELAERGLLNFRKRNIFLPAAIFGSAILLASFNLLPVTIAFVLAVIALIAVRSISAKDVYTSVEWQVVVLIGALIPLGGALQQSGGTTIISEFVAASVDGLPIWCTVASLMLASIWLSDVIPNTTVAVFMAPIGVELADKVGAGPDMLLMAVAVGCAVPFLTPIGHQSNLLVMGPGGYRFLDYARVGFLLELLIVLVATPTIMLVW